MSHTIPSHQPDSVRILISRLGDVAEVVLTLPVACAIRDHYPEAWIGWIVEAPSAALLKNHRAIDELIVLPRHWAHSLPTIRQAKQQLRDYCVDMSIDCQGITKSALAGWLSGAPRRLGYNGHHGRELSGLFYTERIAPVFSHITDRALELLTPLGINTPRVRWDVPISHAARMWAMRWRKSISQKKLAIMNVGGSWASKRWEPARFAATARYIHDRYGFQTAVIWSNCNEYLLAEEVAELSASAAMLAPDTDLPHLAAMLDTADLFVGGDSGALHLAIAVGTTSIGLYGATRPTDSGPYGQIALQRAYEKGTLRRRRRADSEAINQIGVEHVCQQIDEIEAEKLASARAA